MKQPQPGAPQPPRPHTHRRGSTAGIQGCRSKYRRRSTPRLLLSQGCKRLWSGAHRRVAKAQHHSQPGWSHIHTKRHQHIHLRPGCMPPTGPHIRAHWRHSTPAAGCSITVPSCTRCPANSLVQQSLPLALQISQHFLDPVAVPQHTLPEPQQILLLPGHVTVQLDVGRGVAGLSRRAALRAHASPCKTQRAASWAFGRRVGAASTTCTHPAEASYAPGLSPLTVQHVDPAHWPVEQQRRMRSGGWVIG